MSSYLNSFVSQAKGVVEDVRKQVESGEYAAKMFDNYVVKALGPFPKEISPMYFPPIEGGAKGVASYDLIDVVVRVVQSLDVKDDDIALLKLITDNPFGKNTGPFQRLCVRLSMIHGIVDGHIMLVFPNVVTVYVDAVEVLPAYGSSHISVVLPVADVSRVSLVADNVTSMYFHAKHYLNGKHLNMLACASQFVQEGGQRIGTMAVVPSIVPVCHNVKSECSHVVRAHDVERVKAFVYLIEEGPVQIGNMYLNVYDRPVAFVTNQFARVHCIVHPQLTKFSMFAYDSIWRGYYDFGLSRYPVSRI